MLVLSSLHQVRLTAKLNRHLRSKNSHHSEPLPAVNNNVIVNLSKVTLNAADQELLKLNTNFACTVKPSIPKLLAPVERSFKFSQLTSTQKDYIRHLISNNVNFNSSTTKPNLGTSDKKRLAQIQSNPNIVVTKADKGGQIVLMDTTSYIDKVNTLIEEGPYLPIKKDPATKELSEIRTAVKSCHIFSDSVKRSLVPSIANCARFFALPKVHKVGIPLRPIVSNIGTAAYPLAKYLASRFSQLVSHNTFTVKNSIEFAQNIKQTSPQDVLMVSFDVKSLFTNVPVTEALECLTWRLQEFHYTHIEIIQLVNLTKTCLRQCSFRFHDTFYSMQDGLAMGSPLSPILSDIYMHFFEVKLFKKIQFAFYKRYVDDTFILVDKSANFNNILDLMNSIDKHIQFTFEVEDHRTLPFLDILITRTDREFLTSVFRKPFAVSLPPHCRSCHPWNQKMAAFHTLVNRALQICSTPQSLQQELNYLRAVAADRGYPPSVIDQALHNRSKPKKRKPSCNWTQSVILPFYPKVSGQIANIFKKFNFRVIFTPTNKIQLSKIKDSIDVSNRWGIYNIPCKNCPASYIGQTKRALKFRLKEHQNYVKNKETRKSSIANHCWNSNHHFNFSAATIICNPSSVHELDFLEAFHIHKNSTQLVNDQSSVPFISNIWLDLIQQTGS